jgi:hypothetical protein
MRSTTIRQICDYLVHSGYKVTFNDDPIKATLADDPTHPILSIKMEDHDTVRIWTSLECPPYSDKLKLLETTNKLNMHLTVSCMIALIEIDCAVMVGACFPYIYENTIFGLFFDRFIEDVHNCLKVIQDVFRDSDAGKTIIRI